MTQAGPSSQPDRCLGLLSVVNYTIGFSGSVGQCGPEVRHTHNEFEVFKSDPFASPHALEHVEFLEGDDNADHGLVAENQVKSHRQDQHDIESPVPVKPSSVVYGSFVGTSRHMLPPCRDLLRYMVIYFPFHLYYMCIIYLLSMQIMS